MRQRKTNIYCINVGSKTNSTNQLIYKTEIVTDGGNTFMVTKSERPGGLN